MGKHRGCYRDDESFHAKCDESLLRAPGILLLVKYEREAMVDALQQRGLEIAALARIERNGDSYFVPSQYNPRPTKYVVNYGENPTCTCPDSETRGCRCKHIFAVEYTLRRVENEDGSTTVTERVTVTMGTTD
jgi:uncharacterized Zn finger protein